MILVTEVQKFFAGELSAVVGDDNVGDPKPMDDVSEEKDGLLGADVPDGSSLDPFGEFVDGHQRSIVGNFMLHNFCFNQILTSVQILDEFCKKTERGKIWIATVIR